MREAQFIKNNKDRWLSMQESPATHPDETANEFIQLVEDLGYSKTFYPDSGISTYLNTEASKRYLRLYKNSRQQKKRIIRFFVYEIPVVIGRYHYLLLVSFILFVLFLTIGFFSAWQDPGFVRRILGDGYVDMTENNIRAGAPFGVYGYGNELLSFAHIFINNLSVALRFFAGGILLGLPSLYMFMYNGIMIGSFEYLFYSNNLMGDSVLTIMIHGTIELSMIVVAFASGLVLAQSWLFPGTLTRLRALKTGARDGLVIAMANVPMLLLAAFFEGFLTRHSGMPVWLKLVIIVVSFAIIAGYFVVYPIILKKK